MPHGPAYHYSSNKMPDVFWNKADGTVVGFWAREWLDVLGAEVLKISDRYEWEVWQPDFRADQLYSQKLETGVTHRLFPAEERRNRCGLQYEKGPSPGQMISYLKAISNEPLVLMLYGTYGFRMSFYREILREFGPVKKFPIYLRSGGMFKTPLTELYALHRPLTYLSIILEHVALKKTLNYADVISEQSKTALNEVRRIYKGHIEKLTMGCDFDFWIPVVSHEIKHRIQENLNISSGKKVFFASGNFVPRKQLDKLIEVFNTISERDDFYLIIAGQGDSSYTNMLAKLAAPLIKQNKAMLHPYVTGESLRNIYWASDIYISVATDEGGPASVMKAMACNLPVISTPVGATADIMKEYGAGKIVPVKKYSQWRTAVVEILEGRIPELLDLGIAKEAYHWPNVADRYIRVFDDLISAYYLT